MWKYACYDEVNNLIGYSVEGFEIDSNLPALIEKDYRNPDAVKFIFYSARETYSKEALEEFPKNLPDKSIKLKWDDLSEMMEIIQSSEWYSLGAYNFHREPTFTLFKEIMVDGDPEWMGAKISRDCHDLGTLTEALQGINLTDYDNVLVYYMDGKYPGETINEEIIRLGLPEKNVEQVCMGGETLEYKLKKNPAYIKNFLDERLIEDRYYWVCNCSGVDVYVDKEQYRFLLKYNYFEVFMNPVNYQFSRDIEDNLYDWQLEDLFKYVVNHSEELYNQWIKTQFLRFQYLDEDFVDD